MKAHSKAMKHHLPYGIPQRYLPTDTGECALPYPQPNRPVLNLPTPKKWKAELT